MTITNASALIALLASTSALAQVAPDVAQAPPEAVDEGEVAEIVVTAPRLAGSVETDIPPDLELEPEAIEAYGVSSIADLVEALAPQTGTGRGRGGGAPVVLVNGRRVSGFAEIRDLPPEAIRKVETFPEEVALRYGFSADQRVINFILKDDFRAFTAEVEYGMPTSGDRSEAEVEATFVAIGENGRVNVSAEYDRDTAVTEAERGIVQPILGLAEARDLLGASETFELAGTINRGLTETIQGTLNLTYDRTDSRSRFGLSTPDLVPLERDRLSQSGNAGATLDGNIGQWRWTATGNYGVSTVRTLTDTAAGPAAPRDTARSRLTTSNANLLLAGPIVQLPAGPLTASLRAGYERRGFRSRSNRGGTLSSAILSRGDASARASFEIPLASRRRDVASAIGDLSINVNGGYRRLSDFGSLRSFGYGFNWEPVDGVNLRASLSAEEAAPSQQQIGDPLVLTPNATVFDFVRGETAIVNLISGGNPLLRNEDRRDVKISASWQPKFAEGLRLYTEFYRNRASNPLSSFPALTPEIEAAFPGRIVRDASGALVSIDERAINYLSSKSDEIRFGLNFNKSLGPQPEGGRQGRGGMGPGRGPGGPRAGGGRGGGGGRGFGGGGPGERVSTSLIYTLKLADEIVIAPGVPKLDLLNGSTTGGLGGTAEHRIDLEGGYFKDGFGIRAIGAFQSGSTVRDAVGDELRFGSLTTLNLRLFMNFDQRKSLVERVPFLKGSRLSLRVDNVFDTIRNVSDGSGVTPFRFQPGFIDPLGRTVTLSFRKLF